MMIKCRKCKKLIDEYLNQGKPAEIKVKLDAHLTECISCNEYFNEMLVISNSLKNLRKEYNIDVKVLVLDKIKEEQPKTVISNKVYLRYAAVFACMAIIVGVYFMTGGFNTLQKKNSLDLPNYESADGQSQDVRYGIASTPNPESNDISDLSPAYPVAQDDITVLNYISDKNYDEIIQDINIASEEYVILAIYSETAKNEISFISYNIDAEKLVEKLNLKKDTNWKSDESFTGSANEYVKLVIIYSD